MEHQEIVRMLIDLKASNARIEQKLDTDFRQLQDLEKRVDVLEHAHTAAKSAGFLGSRAATVAAWIITTLIAIFAAWKGLEK